VLLVATLFKLPYRVLRCASATGVEVFVLAAPGAMGLGRSRHCAGLIASNHIVNGSRDPELALEINSLAQTLGAGMVIPGDAAATRALIANRDLLDVACFPLPSLEQFDRLNDKWAFAQLCREVGVRTPRARLFADAEALAAELGSSNGNYPSVAKALSLSGSQGMVAFDAAPTRAQLANVNYRPVLLQDFVAGDDICASVFCRGGRIVGFIVYRFAKGTYTAFRDAGIYADVDRIVGPLGVDGVYNFDMRQTPAGEVYYLECNPRFFFKIDLAMIAGVNFVALALDERRRSAPTTVRETVEFTYPLALLRSPRRWPRLSRRDARLALHVYSDPVAHLLDRLGIMT